MSGSTRTFAAAAGSAAGTLLPVGWVSMTVDYTIKLLVPAKTAQIVARAA